MTVLNFNLEFSFEEDSSLEEDFVATEDSVGPPPPKRPPFASNTVEGVGALIQQRVRTSTDHQSSVFENSILLECCTLS